MKVFGILIVLFLGTLASAKTATTTTLSSALNPSSYGQSVTFTAVVTSSQGAPPDGETVTFKQSSTVLGTGALNGGTATFSTSTLKTGGTDSIKATYAGDSNFATSTSNVVSQVVNQASTTTTLNSSQNPSSYGQPVTFTATVTPQFGGVVTGSVLFYNGSTKVATVTVANGVANYTTATLAVGSLAITASYNGSTSFTGSTSAAVSQSVNQANTTTALASSVNPSNPSQSVTFTANVASQFGATATGSVNFYDGATLLKNVRTSAGVATYATSTLASGTHSITADFTGSVDFAASNSSALAQIVNAKKVGTYTDSSMTWDGVTRYYETYIPANPPANPPMIVMLHGTKYTSTFDPEAIITLNWGWQPVADKYGFIVVTPASTWDPATTQWNWNAYFMDAAFPAPAPDDSGFLRQLIVNLTAQYNVNPNMVYVTGMSSGAQMTERVGVEISDLVAAIAPASGQMVGQQNPPPGLPGNAMAPISVQEWHGTLDKNLWPCNYGTTKYSGVTFTLDTVDDTFNYWVQQNACTTLQTSQSLCSNGEPTQGLSGNDATSCAASNIEVQFIWEQNVAHSWQQQNNTARWLFFASHPKQSARK